MEIIELPTEFQLMSPIEKCEILGIITPAEEINKQSKFKFLVIGSLATISALLIIAIIKNEIDKRNNRI